jgi:acyl-CoA dehydrogenase
MASGEIVGSFALTEAEAGSDAGSLRTSARRDGDSYVLNGTKRFITNAPRAGLFTVIARTNPQEAGARGVSAFMVEADTPGHLPGQVPDQKMGQKGAHTCDVIFDDCRIPATALLGGREGQGFRTAMKVLDRGRLHISAVCVGVAERLIRDSLRYAMERKQFGQPIAEFQLIQALLADSKAEAYAARCMVMETARKRMPAWTSAPRPHAARCSPPKWSAGWRIARCRSMAAPAISPITGSSVLPRCPLVPPV